MKMNDCPIRNKEECIKAMVTDKKAGHNCLWWRMCHG